MISGQGRKMSEYTGQGSAREKTMRLHGYWEGQGALKRENKFRFQMI